MTNASSSAKPVSWDRHQAWSWQSPKVFAHARDLRSVAITLNEAVTAAACFVLVFVPGPVGPMPHALLRRGAQRHSPFVGPEGQWQASWLPPRLSAWPFDLAASPGGGHALALHEDRVTHHCSIYETGNNSFRFAQSKNSRNKKP